jgi:hypothetical protein
VYALRLDVEDATGRLHLILFGPDAQRFFAGLPPCDLSADAAAAEALLQRLRQLQGEGCRR